jgi:predicted outer membrane repeat protein
MINVRMNSSHGFGIVGLNVYNSSFDHIYIFNSVQLMNVNNVGCGFIIHFSTHSGIPNDSNSVAVSNSEFINNNAGTTSFNKNCFSSKHQINASNPVINSAALTVLYTQTNFIVDVTIDAVKFINNTGENESGGGLLVYQYTTSIPTYTVVNRCTFESNSIRGHRCLGSSIMYYWLGDDKHSSHPQPLLSVHSTEIKNHQKRNGPQGSDSTGAVLIAVYDYPQFSRTYNFKFTNLTCNNSNVALNGGSCMTVIVFNKTENSTLFVELNDIKADNNSHNKGFSKGGVFSFYHATVSITGTSTFSNNYGSVIDSIDSFVYIYGNVYFVNNKGISGPAVNLQGIGELFLYTDNATFINNSAILNGGAIYANTNFNGDLWLKERCSIQIPNSTSIQFINNNSKKSGNSIFSNNLCKCLTDGHEKITNLTYYSKYFIFNNSYPNDLHQMSSQPLKLMLCGNNTSEVVYPGGTITVSMRAVDSCDSTVFSNVYVYIEDNNDVVINHADNILLENTSSNCTSLSITVLYYGSISQYNSSSILVKLIFYLPNYPEIQLPISLTVLDCPLGFELGIQSGTCGCSKVFDNLPHNSLQCNIKDCRKTVTNPEAMYLWSGLIVNDDGKCYFGMSITCPIDYCNFSTNNGNVSQCSNKSNLICYANRGKTLCGSCINNTSAVFGTNSCKYCSNWWLLTIMLYAAAGPFVIFLLYFFNLTLATGRLNGLIFFFQLSYCGAIDTMWFKNEHLSTLSEVVQILLALFNLNLGFSMCFFDGMTMVWKTGLSLIFPLYLLIIVIVIIIISHYSVKFSNRIPHSSVQILVTVLHLSFSKLVLVIIDVFIPTRIYCSSDANSSFKVWFFDGSLKFGEGSHLILIVITLIIVTPLIIPYITILIFHKVLLRSRFNEYIRPALEAIHAPFKEHKQYWFEGRLILLIFLYIIYAAFRASNFLLILIIFIPILGTFTILQISAWPYKSTINNIIDCWFNWFAFISYSIALGSYVSKVTEVSQEVTILMLIGLLSCGVVFLYHIFITFKLSNRTGSYAMCKLKNFCLRKDSRPIKTTHTLVGSFYSSCNCREPLLEDMQ